MKEEHDVICLKDDKKETAKLEFGIVKGEVWIRIALNDLIIEKKGRNYFDTLREIRSILENQSIRLLCKGCCKCVYPSAMILSMGRGREAYYLTMGKQAETLVDIFDNCSSQEYATMEEQKQYFHEWCNSIQRKRHWIRRLVQRILRSF